jgi:hypothetical protein
VAGVDKFEKATHYLFSSHYTLIESDISSEILSLNDLNREPEQSYNC